MHQLFYMCIDKHILGFLIACNIKLYIILDQVLMKDVKYCLLSKYS